MILLSERDKMKGKRPMTERYEDAIRQFFANRPRLAAALRGTFAEGYTRRDLGADILSGLTVAIVALPLAMALAIASGVPPQHGLYTAIVAGAIAALLGGSRLSVTGPTAAFVVLLAPIASKYGIAGLLIATIMAGVLLVGMGFARFGRLIQFIPHPVTTGFTAGIAAVIALLQVKDFLGLSMASMPEHFTERLAAIWHALPTMRWSELTVGAISLATFALWQRARLRLPAPLVASLVGAIVAAVLSHSVPGFSVETIGTRFSYLLGGQVLQGVPSAPPMPVLPWNLPGPAGEKLALSLETFRSLGLSAFAIAMLGAIESLLCAVAVDAMAGTQHDPDGELIAQGIGNIVAPFFGGIAATGAIARTAANFRAGGRSPFSSFFHALFILAAMLAFAPLLAFLPMATLAALLIMVAWNMSDMRHFRHIVAVAPKSDMLVLLACFGLTVVFDMVIAVGAGIVLAALLFMRRMADLSSSTLIEGHHPGLGEALPDGVMLYEIAGPLFFGAADKAMNAFRSVAKNYPVVIFDLESVPAMDVTGLVALESAIGRVRAAGSHVILAGVQEQPASVIARSHLHPGRGGIEMFQSVRQALSRAREIAPAKEEDLLPEPTFL